MAFWQVHQTQLWAIIIFIATIFYTNPLELNWSNATPQKKKTISIVKLFSSVEKKGAQFATNK
jgi:hypothetical protein